MLLEGAAFPSTGDLPRMRQVVDSRVSARRTILVAVVLAAGLCLAQLRPGPGLDPRAGVSGSFVRIEGGLLVNEDEIRTARETDTHSSGTPNWTNAPGFEEDVFTFTRIIFQSAPGPRSNRGRFRWLGWWVDYPDADLNLSYRLQQLTSINTDPAARALSLTVPALRDSPLLLLEPAAYMRFHGDERSACRRSLASGR